MIRHTPPTRTLREHPNLDQLKRQAKELLEAYRAADAGAAAEVSARYRGADPTTFALHDAQLVLARSYGFDSWPKLKAYVDGVTVVRLADAVRAGDLRGVRSMLDARPELVHMDMAENDEHRALHYAVLHRAPEMVRLLMAYGADARKGIYPHRDATSAHAIATDRGYAEIVAIIDEQEQRRGVTNLRDRCSPAKWTAGCRTGCSRGRRSPSSCSGAPRMEAIPRSCAWRSYRWTGRAMIRAGTGCCGGRSRAAARPDFARYLTCLRLMLERGDPNARGSFGRTLLHDIAVRGTPDEQVAYAALLLDAGARLDVRDDLLQSTPLGWACRWGRVDLVTLLRARGADPIEADAEPWAASRAWPEKRGHDRVMALLAN